MSWLEADSDTTYRRWRIGSRLALMLGAAFLLAWRCRQGVSLAEVGIFFVIYVAASTLWVRGQYQASVDARREDDDDLRPYAFPYWISGAALVVAVVAFLVGQWIDRSTWFLWGAIIGYFALGSLLMRYRSHGRWRVAVGLAALVVSAVALLVGLLLLEQHAWAIALVLPGMLIAPIGLAVLADPVADYLQAPGRGRTVGVVAVVGALMFGGAVLVAQSRVSTPSIAVIALVALALLVLAIVSSTQADIAVVIAAVCLMGVTNASVDKPAELSPKLGDRVLIALGDSYMSGEGAKTYYAEEVDKEEGVHENHCNRAPTAWAALAGQTSRRFDSVKFLACSGARTYNVQHKEGPRQRAQFNEPGTQLDQYDEFVSSVVDDGEEFTPELAVIGLGGNDSGFSTIGVMCLAPGDCIDERSLWEGSLPQVETALAATFAQVNEKFPRTPVLVTAYPNPIYTDPATGEPARCDDVTLSAKDLQFVSEFIPKLNARVEAAATSQGFFFLDEMEGALRGAQLQLCDPGNNDRPGINFIGLSSVGGLAEQRFNPKNWYHNSLHPNERGHAAMLEVFETWLSENAGVQPGGTIRDTSADGAEPPAEPEASGDQGEIAVVTKAPCDLIDDDQSNTTNCRAEGAKWARGQVADKLLFGSSDDWWGLLIGIAVLGAWLLSIALLAFWKPWWGTRPA
ncbi:GDSL-type esterase/lipase family protein [Nocardioides pacificus]